MNVRNFMDYFRSADDEQDSAHMESAHLIIEWFSCKYHATFMDWLDKEASKPIAVTADHMAMVQAAVRSNTLKEIVERLKRWEAEAASVLQSAREENHG